MTEAVRFTVPGRPVPKARPRLGLRGRKAYIYTPDETVQYERTVALVGRQVFREPIALPVEMRVTLYVYGRRVPDVTNAVKSIEDGLNGVAYLDDRQVKRLVAEMRQVDSRDEERAEIEIREYHAEEIAG